MCYNIVKVSQSYRNSILSDSTYIYIKCKHINVVKVEAQGL